MNVVAKSTSKKTTEGAISAAFLKLATDPKLANDKGAKLYKSIMKTYCSGCDPTRSLTSTGWRLPTRSSTRSSTPARTLRERR